MPILYFTRTITYPTLSYYAFHYSRFLESPDQYSLQFRSTVEAYTSFVNHLLSFPDVTITTEYFSDSLMVTYLCLDSPYGGALDSALQEFSNTLKAYQEGLGQDQSELTEVSEDEVDGLDCGTTFLCESGDREEQDAARNYWEYLQEGPQCYYRSDDRSYDYDRNEASHSPTSIFHQGEYEIEDDTRDSTGDSIQAYPQDTGELTSGYENGHIIDCTGDESLDDVPRVQNDGTLGQRESPVYDHIDDDWIEDEHQCYQEDNVQDCTLVYSPEEAPKYSGDEQQGPEQTLKTIGDLDPPLEGIMDGEDDIYDVIQACREATMSDSELDRLYMLGLRASTSESFVIEHGLVDICDYTEPAQDETELDTDEIRNSYEDCSLDYERDEARFEFYPNDEMLVYEQDEDEGYEDDYGYEEEFNDSSEIMHHHDHSTDGDVQEAVDYDFIYDSNAACIRFLYASLSFNSGQPSCHYEHEEQQGDTTFVGGLGEEDYADVVTALEDALDDSMIAYTPLSYAPADANRLYEMHDQNEEGSYPTHEGRQNDEERYSIPEDMQYKDYELNFGADQRDVVDGEIVRRHHSITSQEQCALRSMASIYDIKSTSYLPSFPGSFILSPSPSLSGITISLSQSISTMNSIPAICHNSVYESFLLALLWSVILCASFLTVSVITAFGALRDVDFVLSPRFMINGNVPFAKENNEAGHESISWNILDKTLSHAELAVGTSTSHDSFFGSPTPPYPFNFIIIITPNADRQLEFSSISEWLKRLGIAILRALPNPTSLLSPLSESVDFQFTKLMNNLEFTAFIMIFWILHTDFFKFSSCHCYSLALHEYAKEFSTSTVIAISGVSTCVKSCLRLAIDGLDAGVIRASRALSRTSVSAVFVTLRSTLCAVMEFGRYWITWGIRMCGISTMVGCEVVGSTPDLDHDDRGDEGPALLSTPPSQPQFLHNSKEGRDWEQSFEQVDNYTDKACHDAGAISLKDLMKSGMGFDKDGNPFRLGGGWNEILCFVMNGSESSAESASDHPPPPACNQSGVSEREREEGTIGSRFWNMITSTRRRILPSRPRPGLGRQIGRSANHELEPGERGESEVQQAEEEEEEERDEGMVDATLIEEDMLAALELAMGMDFRKDDAEDNNDREKEAEGEGEGEGEGNLDMLRPVPRQSGEDPEVTVLESPEHEDRHRPVADPRVEWNLPQQVPGVEEGLNGNEDNFPGPSGPGKRDANAQEEAQMIGPGTGTAAVDDFDFSGTTAVMNSMNDGELELTRTVGADVGGLSVNVNRHGDNYASDGEEQLKKRRKKKERSKRSKDQEVKDSEKEADHSLSLSLSLPTPTLSANSTTTPRTEQTTSTESDVNISTNSNTTRSSTPRNMTPPWNVGSTFATASSRRNTSPHNALRSSLRGRERPGDISQTSTSASMNMNMSELEWAAQLDGIPIPHNDSDDEEFGISLKLKVKPKEKMIEASIEATPKIWSVRSNFVDIKSSPPLSEFDALARGLATSILPSQTPESHSQWGRLEDVRELESRELEFGKWAWRDNKGVPRMGNGSSPGLGLGVRSISVDDDDPPDLIDDDSDVEESDGEVLPTLGSRLALVDLEEYPLVAPVCEDGEDDGEDEDEDIDGSPLPVDEESTRYESLPQLGTGLGNSTTPVGDPEEWNEKLTSRNASGSGGRRVTFDIPHDTDDESEDGLRHTKIDLSGLGPETPCPPPKDVAQKSLQDFCLQSKAGPRFSQVITSTPARSRRTKESGSNDDDKAEPKSTTPTTTPPAYLLLAARLKEASGEANSDTETDEEPVPPLTSTPKNFAPCTNDRVDSETESESERTPRFLTPGRVSCAPSPPRTPATPSSHHISTAVQHSKEDTFAVGTNELPNSETPATINAPRFTPHTPIWGNNYQTPVQSAFCNAPPQTQTYIPPTPSCAYQMGLPPPPPQYAPRFSAFALPQLQLFGSVPFGTAASTSTSLIDDYPQDMDVDIDPNEPVPMDVDDPDIEMLDLTGQQTQPCLSAFNVIPERMGQHTLGFSSPAPPPPPFQPASYTPFNHQPPVQGSQFYSHNPPIMATSPTRQRPGVDIFRNANAPLYLPRSRENKRLNNASTDIGRSPPSVFCTLADFTEELAWGHQNAAHRGLMSFGGMNNSRGGKQRRGRGEMKRRLRKKVTQRQESGKLSRQIAAMTNPSKLTSRHMFTYAHGSIPKLLLKRQMQSKGQALYAESISAWSATGGVVRREPRGISIATLQGRGASKVRARAPMVVELESEPSVPV